MSPRSNKIRTTLAVTMALGAVAPAAHARLATDAVPPTTTSSVHDVKSVQDLRRAAPTSSLAGTVDPGPQVVTVSAPSGFDWGDAAIGAAGGLGLALAAVGGTFALAGRRRHSMPRELAS